LFSKRKKAAPFLSVKQESHAAYFQ